MGRKPKRELVCASITPIALVNNHAPRAALKGCGVILVAE